MKLKFFIVMLCLSSNVYGLELSKEIPKNFHGRWADHPDNCAFIEMIGSYHPNSMKIDSNSITYFESGGKAAAIVSRKRNEVAMIFDFHSEADKFIYFKHFSLSEDGNKLYDYSKYESSKEIYFRCAKE